MELFTRTYVKSLEHTMEGRDQWSTGDMAFARNPGDEALAWASWQERPDATVVTVSLVGGPSTVLGGGGAKLGPTLVRARRWVEAQLGR